MAHRIYSSEKEPQPLLDGGPSEADPPHSGCFVISVAAEMLGVHPQTLRHYERLGLVIPSRTDGNIRLYSTADIARLHRIQQLINHLGVNLAGVEVILHMHDQLERMQQAYAQQINALRAEYEAEIRRLKAALDRVLREREL
ncbi:MAG: helix-turn-helix transcriptional regulator [Chloroflexi bacterium]|nr:helix-turn-helix transcriptional regulator [Chloroflexota bacterium]